jgi:8-oxo-dGTP pyrophosphatase MutT (NUDIX family)
MSSRFERLDSEPLYEGGFISLQRMRFRHEDGKVVERDIVVHTGAVGVVTLDERDQLWFVRQPREAVGVPDLLEIPAGKRELAEEIGKRAEHWEPLGSFFTSPGFATEEIHLFLATGLSDVERPEVEEDERIDVEVRPLSDLDAILAETKDSKTLIGLYRLKDRLGAR